MRTKVSIFFAVLLVLMGLTACGEKGPVGQKKTPNDGIGVKQEVQKQEKDAGTGTGFASKEEAFRYLYGSEAEPITLTFGVHKKHHKIPQFEIMLPDYTEANEVKTKLGEGYEECFVNDYQKKLKDIISEIEVSEYMPMAAILTAKGDGKAGIFSVEIDTEPFYDVKTDLGEIRELADEWCASEDVAEYDPEIIDINENMFAVKRIEGIQLYMQGNCDSLIEISCTFLDKGTESSVLEAIKMTTGIIAPTEDEIAALLCYEQEKAYPAFEYLKKFEVESVDPITDENNEAMETLAKPDEEYKFVFSQFNIYNAVPSLYINGEILFKDEEKGIIVERSEDGCSIGRYDCFEDETGAPGYTGTYAKFSHISDRKSKAYVIRALEIMGINAKDADW